LGIVDSCTVSSAQYEHFKPTYLHLLHVGKDLVGVFCHHRRVVQINVVLERLADGLELALASVLLLWRHAEPVVLVVFLLEVLFAWHVSHLVLAHQSLNVHLYCTPHTVNVHLRHDHLIVDDHLHRGA